MNKNRALVLSFCLIAVSCGVDEPMEKMACTSVELPDKCGNPNSAGSPMVVITRGKPGFAPPWVCAKQGSTIEFKLTPAAENEVGNAAILAKDPKITWLVGTNSTDKDKISILVPIKTPEGIYEYGLTLSNGKCADPRVEVVKGP